MTRDYLRHLGDRFPVAIIVTILIGLVVFGCYMAGRIAAQSATDKVDRDARERARQSEVRDVRGCERGNIARGQQLRDDLEAGRHEDYRRDRHISPILDCRLTVAAGNEPVPLTPAQQRAYVDAISDGRVPVITSYGEVR